MAIPKSPPRLSSPVLPQREPESIEAICRERGMTLTRVRRATLEALRKHRGPVGAYEVMKALSIELGRKVSPPTVYRGLEALAAHGLIARIESRNAFLARDEPHRPPSGVYYLCINCGSATEVIDAVVERRVAYGARQLHFKVARQVHEIEGTCEDCQAPKKI